MTQRRIKKPQGPSVPEDKTNRPQVTILIVSRDTLVRRGLRSILEEQPGWIIAETTNPNEIVSHAILLRPQVVIVDINFGQLDAANVTRSIITAIPDIRVLAFCTTDSEYEIQRALDAGVLACVPETDAEQELAFAVNALLKGKTYFPACIFKQRHAHEQLTNRELEVMKLIVEGKTNREASAALRVSVRTIEAIRPRIMRKLSLKTLCDLMRYAIRNGIVEL